MRDKGKIFIIGGIALLVIVVIAVALALGGFKLPFMTLPSFYNVPQLAKTNQVYTVYINEGSPAYPATATMAYIGYSVKSLKIDGVERPVSLPDVITTTNGVHPVLYEKNSGNTGKTILGFNQQPGIGNVPIYSVDVSQFTGTHTITIVVATGFGSGACYSNTYGDCVLKLQGNYFNWNDYTLTDTFTNQGPTVEVCGNGQCLGTETFQTCPADCPAPQPTCNNNGVCDSGETIANCQNDCHIASTYCGDRICNGNENCTTCSSDCGTCPVITKPQDQTMTYIAILAFVGITATVLVWMKFRRK